MLDDAVSFAPPLAVLWGKSKSRGGGSMNLLLAHLLDTAAVGELLWDSFLAPSVRRKLDACCGGRGRSLLALLCGLHDVGKASPAFQSKDPELAARVFAAGLAWRPLDRRSKEWHHTLAGAVIVLRCLTNAGWNRESVGWVWPLIGGHHGVIPALAKLSAIPGRGNAQGSTAWIEAQDDLVRRVVNELGVDLHGLAPDPPLHRATQLALSGAIIMADWIASDQRSFIGIEDLGVVSMSGARKRAECAWKKLRLRGGWDPASLSTSPDPLAARFQVRARASQRDAVALARKMPTPGLLILEAPMGEGKTEAALAAVEILARRFGADGLFVGMPTQATCDPMYTRVRRWSAEIEAGLPVGLLHGKRRFNAEWRALTDKVRIAGVDDYDVDDPYGAAAATGALSELPAEWFLGAKRGLLTPLTVGTIDQLLHAATRTRHVMLRHVGLAGRVVVLDEVHAYDVYMSQFLFEALRWLADGGVPVVVLSATLPPAMRRELMSAYLQGALNTRDVDIPRLPQPDGYPSVTSVCVVDGQPVAANRSSPPWRESLHVRVESLEESPDDPPETSAEHVAALLRGRLVDGGCVLVVRNTVRRAQATYGAVKRDLGADVVLLHGRLTAAARAERTERVLELLGKDGKSRPGRLVVVATQLAEQSFDVDVDLLISDLAPIDLLLQRIGRLHRHQRPADGRPPLLRTPTVVVTGWSRRYEGPPRFARGSSFVYGDYLLLRTAALVSTAVESGGWNVPADVPELVGRTYGDEAVVPEPWAAQESTAHTDWEKSAENRRAAADDFLLAGSDATGLALPTLEGLHRNRTSDLSDDDAVAAVVRDGDPSVEVVLVRRDERGYLTLDGRAMGPTGEAAADDVVAEQVVQATIRLPSSPGITAAAIDELRPLPGWGADPWLRRARALVLDDTGSAVIGRYRFRYDEELGLIGPSP